MMTNNLFVRLMTFSRVVSLFYIIKNYLTHEENISLVVTGMPNLCGYGSAHQHPDGKGYTVSPKKADCKSSSTHSQA